MDVTTLTSFMKKLIENLPVQTNDCSDEFLTTLNELIQKATEVSKNIERKRSSHTRERSYTSSGSEVLCTTDVNMEVIEVDTDSDDSGLTNNGPNDSLKTIQSSTKSSEAVSPETESTVPGTMPQVKLKRLNVKEICKKRWVVKLHRIKVTNLSTAIHGQVPKVSRASGPQSRNAEKKATSTKMVS